MPMRSWSTPIAGSARPPAPSALRDLAAVDSPRPGRVRFLLDRPVEDFPSALADPRFGLVAPGAAARVRHRATSASTRAEPGRSSTGSTTAASVLLARNAGWWGTPLGLGPGVDQVELTAVGGGAGRVSALVGEGAEIADQLGRRAARRRRCRSAADRRSPAAGSRSASSVRSAASTPPAAAQSLADVWLTDLR